MLDPESAPEVGSHSAPHCEACSGPISPDQRYCVECGERRGPLPRKLAATIVGILEQGRPVPAASGPAVRPDQPSPGIPARLPAWMPSARAAAVAVLCMLAFGAFLGSAVNPSVANTLSAPLQVLVSLGSAPPAVSVAGSSGPDSSPTGATTPLSVTPPSTLTPASAAPLTQQPASSVNQTPGLGPTTGGSGGLPPIKHVFLIVLSNQGYGQTFGSTNKYLAQTLPKQGGLVPQYYAVTPGELANGIAMISGQGPTQQTAANCPTFVPVTPGTTAKLGQVLGTGCVYPARAKTLADELSGPKHGGWKAYVEGIDRGRKGQPATCRHPALGGSDGYQEPRPKDAYVTWRNPFVYFHSLIDGSACKKRDVALTRLASDLKQASTTPALSYVVPSPCDDGSDQPCERGARAGLAPAIKFLQSVLPGIKASPAYKADGMIAVTFDQAPQTGLHADSTGCCSSQNFPNLPAVPGSGSTTTSTATTTPPPTTTTAPAAPTSTTTTATSTTTTTTTATAPTTTTTTTATTPTVPGVQAGGGQVGIVLISRYVKPGSVDYVDSYNHFSLLATIEKLLGVSRLGYASDGQLPVFGPSSFNNY